MSCHNKKEVIEKMIEKFENEKMIIEGCIQTLKLEVWKKKVEEIKK